MRVRMLVGLSGPAILLEPGDEHEFADTEADRLIKADFAVRVENNIERAVARPVVERRVRKGRANVVSGEGNNSGRGAD